MVLPERWELTVFKAVHKEEPTNFIKRAVGLPGEEVELARGDVFVNGKRVVKPADAFDQLWFFVHDTHYESEFVNEGFEGWQPADDSSIWKREGAVWTVSSQDDEAHALAFRTPLLNRSQYSEMSERPGRMWSSLFPVEDIRVDLTFSRFNGSGPCSVEWKTDLRTLSLICHANGRIALQVDGNGVATTDIAGGLDGFAGPISVRVRDGVASLVVDGKTEGSFVMGSQSIDDHRRAGEVESWDGEAKFRGGRLAIIARACDVALSRISIHRDVFYEPTANGGGLGCTGCMGNPIQLGHDEYYMLGDNSRYSFDSRFWPGPTAKYEGAQIGAVPRRAIVGVARMIYWPPRRMKMLD